MSQIRLGVLTSVLGTAGEGIRNSVRGIVQLDTGLVEAYVKLIDQREILVECVCALLARNLKLEVPEPLVVLIRPEFSNLPSDALAFGSIGLSAGNLRPWFSNLGDVAVKRRLRQWANLIPACCFDEWIANVDRHAGNILYDGRDRFWLIDHGLAIAHGLQSDVSVTNHLMGVAIEGLGEVDRLTLKPKALGIVDVFAQEQVEPVFAQIPAGIWQQDVPTEISGWLKSRQSHLARLVDAKIPTQQGSLFSGGQNG